MANKKASDLPLVVTLTDTDGFVVLDPEDTSSTPESGPAGTLKRVPLSTLQGTFGSAAFDDSSEFATAAQGALADSALQAVDIPSDLTATGTPSASTFLRGDGTWATPAGSGAGVTSGSGPPVAAPTELGSIYIDTLNDDAYIAVGTATAADWEISNDGGGGAGSVAVVAYSSGWPARPTADIVFWVANGNPAATTPGAAIGDDVIILAERETIAIACSDMTTAITTGTTKAYWVAPWACTLVGVKATLATAGSGLTTIDINEGAGAGTTMLSTKLTIDSTETDSAFAAIAAVISDSSIAANGRITIDFDGVGTGATGVIVYLTVVKV